jgi:hypothetical protein
MYMIKWNEVTWYSRILTIVLFIGFMPALSFYVGTQYQQTVDEVVLEVTVGPVIFLPAQALAKSNDALQTSAATSTASTTR